MSKLLISNFVPEHFRPGLGGSFHQQLLQVWRGLAGLHVAAHRLVILTEALELDALERLVAEALPLARFKHIDLAFSRETVPEADRPRLREQLDALVARLEAEGIAATWTALSLPGRHFQSKGYALADERETHVKAGIVVLTSADLTHAGFGYDDDATMELGIWSMETDSVGHFLELFDALRAGYGGGL